MVKSLSVTPTQRQTTVYIDSIKGNFKSGPFYIIVRKRDERVLQKELSVNNTLTWDRLRPLTITMARLYRSKQSASHAATTFGFKVVQKPEKKSVGLDLT